MSHVLQWLLQFRASCPPVAPSVSCLMSCSALQRLLQFHVSCPPVAPAASCLTSSSGSCSFVPHVLQWLLQFRASCPVVLSRGSFSFVPHVCRVLQSTPDTKLIHATSLYAFHTFHLPAALQQSTLGARKLTEFPPICFHLQ
jgi:hypothetical protein